MQIRLAVIRGKLQNRAGNDTGPEVRVNKKRFVIGSAEDCHMRCKSRTISPHHCMLLSDDSGVFVRDLGSEAGTFINNQRIVMDHPLIVGDHLRIGKLEFQIKVDRPILKPAEGDAVDHLVSDILVQADEVEREQRRFDPNSREFRLPVSQGAPPTLEQREPSKRTIVKRPPAKLPPAPSIHGKSSVDSAQLALEQIFQKKSK